MNVAFGKGQTTLTGPIIDGYVLRQSFVALDTPLQAVHVLLSTYKRRNAGTLTAEIFDAGNKPLARTAVSSADLKDNAKHVFRFSVSLVPGAMYEFRIKTLHCRSGYAATAHYAAQKHPGDLFVGGKLCRHMELTCDFEYSADESIDGSPEAISRRDKSVQAFLRERNPLLSIIILNKDGRDLLPKCVDAIISNTDYEDIEVIIGDTGTTDPDVLEYYGSLPPNVRVVSGLDYHFSKTNNLLARKHAKGDYLLFLNNDVFLEADAISAMMNHVRVYKIGAVGLRLLKLRGVIDHDGQILFKKGILTTPDHLNVNFPPDKVLSEDGVTDGVTAACVLTRKALFLALDGFDEAYDDVYQDCDYCLKLLANGFCCVTVRSVSATHVGSATRGTTKFKDPVVTRDRNRFHKKWSEFHLPEKPLFSFITCCNNPETYAGFMASLPERVGWDVELVPINNHDNRFTVTRALNLGAVAARGKWRVYCHQDILLCDAWIRRVKHEISCISNPDVGMVGFEGLKDGGIPYSCKSLGVGRTQEVQTLDELCILTNRKDIAFDELFLFHYYGADICLQAEAKGLTNYLIGVPTRHLSGGQENVTADIEGFKREAGHFRDKWPHKQVWTTTTKFLDGGIYYMMLPDVLND